MYDRINNWINDGNIFSNETNCNYFTIDEFKDLSNNIDESFSIFSTFTQFNSILTNLEYFWTL